MMNDNFSHESNSHLALSLQLLHLLKWLVEHDDGALKAVIEKAFVQGAYRDIKRTNYAELDPAHIEEMHHSVLDFFNVLECYLEETYHQHTRRTARQTVLQATIDHIDTNVIDDENVLSSVESATSRIEQNPQRNAKQMLYEELLKQWEPEAGTTYN